MRLFFLFLTLYLVINLNGMQLSENTNQYSKKLTLRNAMELVCTGKGLVVYYNDNEKPTKDYSTQIIQNFRNDQSIPAHHITDYVVSGALQFESKPNHQWSDMPTSIAAILSAKNGSGFYPCGFVVYTTQSNDLYAFERYMNHLHSLKKAHVPVIIYAHDRNIAERIFYQSSIESSRKNLIINGSLVPLQSEWKKYCIAMLGYGCGTAILFGVFCLISCDLKTLKR